MIEPTIMPSHEISVLGSAISYCHHAVTLVILGSGVVPSSFTPAAAGLFCPLRELLEVAALLGSGAVARVMSTGMAALRISCLIFFVIIALCSLEADRCNARHTFARSMAVLLLAIFSPFDGNIAELMIVKGAVTTSHIGVHLKPSKSPSSILSAVIQPPGM
jgi:hypothetical protein